MGGKYTNLLFFCVLLRNNDLCSHVWNNFKTLISPCRLAHLMLQSEWEKGIKILRNIKSENKHPTHSLVLPLIEGQPVIKGHHLRWGQAGHIICLSTFCEVPGDESQRGIFALEINQSHHKRTMALYLPQRH